MVRALASHQCGLSSNPGVDTMWAKFVVGSLPCSKRIISGYPGDYLRVSGSPLSLKPQHFQILIRSGTHGHVSTSSYELISTPWVKKLQYYKVTLRHNTSENE